MPSGFCEAFGVTEKGAIIQRMTDQTTAARLAAPTCWYPWLDLFLSLRLSGRGQGSHRDTWALVWQCL